MKKILSLLLISFAGINNLFAQLTVDPSATPNDLVNAITAGGIAVSNISYTGIQAASCTFLCPGACNLGISGGILLTSGSATIATLPNTQTGQGMDNGLAATDTLLNTLTTGQTQDVTVLEFDFIAISDTIEFNYVFASEEYSDYVNTSCNDVFGFFISGPGITGYKDIAIVPGTAPAVPMTINNVNNGNAPHGVLPPGPCEYCQYFIDNTAPVTYTIAYDGLTTILTATETNIQPGQTYHLKLAVADVCDGIFDTGVFLEAGSFLAPAPPAMYAGGNRITGNTVHICQGGSVSLSAPAGFSYLWNTGETTQAISVSTAGTFYCTITGTNVNYPVVSPSVTFIVDNTSIPTPVLTFANNIISSSVNTPNYNYSWTLDGSPIPGANLPSVNFMQSGCYAVTVQDPGGCYVTSDTLCVIPLGINEIASSNNIKLYPNPFRHSSKLTFDNPVRNNFELKIIDITGRELQCIKNIFSDNVTIEKGILNEGIYFYELINVLKNEIHKGKMVIN